jgi:hypothetical protein
MVSFFGLGIGQESLVISKIMDCMHIFPKVKGLIKKSMDYGASS